MRGDRSTAVREPPAAGNEVVRRQDRPPRSIPRSAANSRAISRIEKCVARLEEHLAAQQPAVAVVDPAAGNHVLDEAVALDLDAVEPERDAVAERPGQRRLGAAIVVIADARSSPRPKA